MNMPGAQPNGLHPFEYAGWNCDQSYRASGRIMIQFFGLYRAPIL